MNTENHSLPVDELFRGFVAQQQQLAMMYLGKFVHPESGKLDRNLDAARYFIDMLGMLEAKTKGNLSSDEANFLSQVLSNLRLNFVEEANKPAPEPAPEAKPEPSPEAKPEPEPPAPEAKPEPPTEEEKASEDRSKTGAKSK